MIWISLLLLGLILYFIVQYGVARVTRTPWWILWLVLMMPAFLMGFWAATHTDEEPIPAELLVGGFLISSILYIVLVQKNRRTPPAQTVSTELADKLANPPAPSPTRLLNSDEEGQLQHCFPWSVYYLQEIDHRPQAVICRGQLRSQPEAAYQKIQDNIHQHFGDRFLVIFQQGAQNKPFFVLVPNPQAQPSAKRAPISRPGLALGLLFATLVTTTLAGLSLAQPNLTESLLRDNPDLLLAGLPYAIALLAILGTHEMGHYFTARWYKIKASLPYFIPVPFAFGTFGAFIRMRAPVPDRKALFDVGIAGPLAGLAITLPILVWGLMQSTLVDLPEQPQMLSPEAFNPRLSILFTLISRAVFGGELSLSHAIALHPIAIAGWLGLIVTALNLMPVGQLDGGHIVHAMYGQRMGAIIGQVSRILVLLLSLVQPILLFWAIILLFMPAIDEPTLNDVSELDNGRDILGLVALAILLVIILPVPNAMTPLLFSANPLP
ncbi:site-2 protease family protein [Synechococcales cyanobacterium C]|uniref:Site-2 protease family protein n=1 Tax=Petrachloros mirabilis ULC683 TaxID=2781853 RepID=A0A8K2A100_9CYAN|nr:site-2 protease family protein [Petrachloros mirabilis]NCJ08493.1 site-2 protease family protein [Petrachloros mirabilis ULC683]